MEIRLVTGDKKGLSVSRRRIVDHMGFSVGLVSTVRRVDWIKDHYNLSDVVYMGDRIFDH
jgi:3-deoxy-D-manno-octulosonate 8-phosphate phosphatase (KDO 8-P phosphatase)